MALTDGLSAADVAAVTGGNGFGGMTGDGAWWLIVLFLFAMNSNWGWGGQQSRGTSDVQSGFDQQAVMSGIAGINASLANAEVSRCNTQATLLQALNSSNSALVSDMNGLAMALQNCCCENRSSVADLKYTIATEAAASRAAGQANTQAILDKLCQQETEALKTQIVNLQTQLNMANLQASQTAQTARILADNQAQTSAIEQYLNPAPIPAYVVQNPNGCNCGGYSGCAAYGVA